MKHESQERMRSAVSLFLISALSLYFEILFIRWIPSDVQIVAYFENIVLISAFLGLSIGLLLAEFKRDLLQLFPLSLAVFVVITTAFRQSILAVPLGEEHLLGFYAARGVYFLVVIALIFVVHALVYVPLGQALGRHLKRLPALTAYSLNIAGSITGVLIFSFLSYRMLSPLYWFLVGTAMSLLLFSASLKKLLLQSVIMLGVLLFVTNMQPGSHWSPYYKIDIFPIVASASDERIGYQVSANNTLHQYAFNLSNESVKRFPEMQRYKSIYEFPYTLTTPRRVLVLGAGSGNDVAAALRRGVKEITAVEIDPFIASLGSTLHDERPYAAGQVRLRVDDARAFIRKCDESFDLITFGYLDAHEVLSQFSSVRLDNFIYTKESFQDIKRHLAPNGLVCLTYLVFREWVGAKLYATMREVFGDEVKVVRTSTYTKDDTAIYLAGDGLKNIPATLAPGFTFYDGFDRHAPVISDDWPYLYLVHRGIPHHYLSIIVFILLVGAGSVWFIRPLQAHRFNAHFFFLGAGFLLLETVSITRFALLFGSTWVVNSAVIVSVLVMALLATLCAAKVRTINVGLLYGLLFGAILLNWLVKPETYLALNKSACMVLSSFMLSLPIFFAGVIFAASFKKTKDVSGVFSCNLLGALIGGILEYLSMQTGFNFLLLIAFGLYLLSYLSLKTAGRG